MVRKRVRDEYMKLRMNSRCRDRVMCQKLIDYIKDEELLVTLTPNQHLCHVTPATVVNLAEPMYFAQGCGYGMWLQYSRNTLDSYSESEDEEPELNFFKDTPDHFFSVEITVPDKPIVLVDNSQEHFNDWEDEWDNLNIGMRNQQIIETLMQLDGIEGIYSKDPVSTHDFSFTDSVDEVAIFRPYQTFSNFKIETITQEHLQYTGRTLNHLYKEVIPRGYSSELISITSIPYYL